jgi:HAD superfamily hydrolase (TIGR01549 family)
MANFQDLSVSSKEAIRVFLFDLDGTLVDNSRLEAEVACRVLGEDGVIMTPEKFLRSFPAANYKTEVFPGVEKKFDKTFSPEQQRAIENRIIDNILLSYEEMEKAGRAGALAMPGAGEMLQALKDAGYTLAIASGSYPRWIEASVRAAGLASFFEGHLYSAEDTRVGNPKPAPDLLLMSAQELGVPPKNIAYVGDAIKDMQAAGAANMLPIGFVDPHFDAEQKKATVAKFEEAGAEHIVMSLAEIPVMFAAQPILRTLSAPLNPAAFSSAKPS